MATDYEKFYQGGCHALGEPTKEFVDFFRSYKKEGASILDLGCGQGRDALFIARLGHRVVGVDIAKTGIRDLLDDAKKENLNVEGVVSDLRTYQSAEMFDIVLIDRTLHMLSKTDRLGVLTKTLTHVKKDGSLLIADEPSNLPDFKQALERSKFEWDVFKEKKDFLFARKGSA